ncbi:MAG: DUF4340 domain-containing protein [Ruminococcus sp.]|jgi:hypothetical protein|nr:DUF4340 domain-containing protein [Ruminococcus sp.]
MNKKVKGIIGLGAVLAVLGGGLAYLKNTEPADDKSSSSSSSVAESGAGIQLIRKDTNTVKQIDISNSQSTFTVLRTAKAKSDKENPTFTIKGYENIPLVNTTIYTLANNVSELDSLSVVTDSPDDLSKYGLDKPEVTATFYYDSGDPITIYIGNISPVSTATYFMMKGSNTVYTVSTSSLSNYRDSISAYVSKTIVEKPADDDMPVVKNLSIHRQDLDYDIKLQYDERSKNDKYKGGTASTHVMTEPIYCYLSLERSTSAVTGIFGLTASDFYKILPDESDIAEAGLTSPFCTVTTECDNGKTYKLLLSEPFTDDDGVKCYYAMLDGGNIIYIVSADKAVWGTIKPIDIASSNIFGSTIWDIRQMVISGKDIKTDTFDGNGSSADDYKVTKNGKSLDTERFRLFYAFLLSTSADDLAIGKTVPADAKPLVSVSIKDTYMDKPQEISFYEDGSLSCIITVDGQARFICSRSYVDTLIGNIAKIDTGENYVTTWK